MTDQTKHNIEMLHTGNKLRTSAHFFAKLQLRCILHAVQVENPAF